MGMENVKNEQKRSMVDTITFGLLKVEAILLVGVIAVCIFKLLTAF